MALPEHFTAAYALQENLAPSISQSQHPQTKTKQKKQYFFCVNEIFCLLFQKVAKKRFS